MSDSPQQQSEITRLLSAWQEGDQAALNELMPLVISELKRIAGAHLSRERAAHVTLQPTALVHEAYLRLVGLEPRPWQGRAQFYALSATIMRHILVDHARARKGKQRGGEWRRTGLEEAAAIGGPADGISELDDALTRLERSDPRKARLAELRLFAGMTNEEAAEALGVSLRTVVRDWSFTKAWLGDELGLEESPSRQ